MTVRVERLASAVPTTVRSARWGWVVVAGWLVWIVLVAQAVLLFAVSILARYGQLRHPPADVRAQLAHADLSPVVYAVYLSAINSLFAFVCCAVTVLIVRHRPHDPISLVASLLLVLSGLTNSPEMQAVVARYPSLAVPANSSLFILILTIIGFFFVFPDGQVVPRRASIPLLIGAAGCTLVFVITGASIAADPPDWLGQFMLIGSVTGIAAQIYRYVRCASPLQRQQTKWVVLGASAAILTTLFFSFAGSRLPTIGRPETGYDLTGTTGVTIASLLLPISLGVAILRYHLWNIDLVVNRSLVYGALTAGLLGLYLAVVDGLGVLVQARGRLPFSLVATALVAVLFAPLRFQVQSAVNRLMYGERDDPYRVLTRVGERVGAASAPQAALQAIADTVAGALKSPYVAMTLTQTNTSAPAASHGAFVANPLHFPLEYQGETVGELLVAPRGPGQAFSPADRRLLTDLAHQIGPPASAVRLTADLQRSRERLVTAREEERRRLRRDLHDGLGPQLAALTLKIETIRNQFAQDPALDAALVDLTSRTQVVLADIRRLVYGLRPPALDELGLLSALHQTAAQYGQAGDGSLQVVVDAPESLPALSAASEVAAYRIAQEALANVARHAAARTCCMSVTLDSAQDVLRLSVMDDGQGLPDRYRAGVGLVSMRERAEELGGHCTVASSPDGGVVVTVELPCHATLQHGIGDETNERGTRGHDPYSHRR